MQKEFYQKKLSEYGLDSIDEAEEFLEDKIEEHENLLKELDEIIVKIKKLLKEIERYEKE